MYLVLVRIYGEDDRVAYVFYNKFLAEAFANGVNKDEGYTELYSLSDFINMSDTSLFRVKK